MCHYKSHTIHHPWDWYVYLHLVDFHGFHVGKYTSPIDAMGIANNNVE